MGGNEEAVYHRKNVLSNLTVKIVKIMKFIGCVLFQGRKIEVETANTSFANQRRIQWITLPKRLLIDNSPLTSDNGSSSSVHRSPAIPEFLVLPTITQHSAGGVVYRRTSHGYQVVLIATQNRRAWGAAQGGNAQR